MALVINVRITPASGHGEAVLRCPLCAKSRRSAVQRKTSLFAADVSSTQRSLHPVARQRQFSDTLASRVGESIHDRGNRGPLRTFASAERLLSWTVDKLDLNVRHVAHCQDRIALPITRGDPIAVEVDLLV